MRFSYFLLITVMLFACSKKKDRYPSVQLGSHACSGLAVSSALYHDNSLEAYNYALSYQEITVIEMDIHISANGTAWLFHDANLAPESTGNGCIPEMQDTELAALHYTTLEKEKLTRLSDLPGDLGGKLLLLDLRELNSCSGELLDSLLIFTALEKATVHFYNGQIGIVSNTNRFLQAFQSKGWITYHNAYNAGHFMDYPGKQWYSGTCIRNSDISEEEVKTIKSAGYEVVLYDVRSPKGIRKAFKKHPDYVLTDDIKAAILEKYR